MPKISKNVTCTFSQLELKYSCDGNYMLFEGFLFKFCINQYAPCSKSEGPPTQKNAVFLFFLIMLNFKKATSLQNYLIYLYSRISSMYF